MVSMLPDELHTFQPLREYFVGHSEECMDERMHAVPETKKTVISLAEEKSQDSQDENYDSSSSSNSLFESYPTLSHGGLCQVPYLADMYPGPMFVEKTFDAFKCCHASTLGFEFPVLGHIGEKSCYCPCGKHMKNWRD
eukprot:3856997-Ditylum_brightwellii.AAC.1